MKSQGSQQARRRAQLRQMVRAKQDRTGSEGDSHTEDHAMVEGGPAEAKDTVDSDTRDPESRWYHTLYMVPFFNIIFELFLDDDTPTDDQIKESLNLTALINALMLATIVVAPSTFNYEDWILIDERFADGNYKVWRDNLFFGSRNENRNLRLSSQFMADAAASSWLLMGSLLSATLCYFIFAFLQMDNERARMTWWRWNKWVFLLQWAMTCLGIWWSSSSYVWLMIASIPDYVVEASGKDIFMDKRSAFGYYYGLTLTVLPAALIFTAGMSSISIFIMRRYDIKAGCKGLALKAKKTKRTLTHQISHRGRGGVWHDNAASLKDAHPPALLATPAEGAPELPRSAQPTPCTASGVLPTAAVLPGGLDNATSAPASTSKTPRAQPAQRAPLTTAGDSVDAKEAARTTELELALAQMRKETEEMRTLVQRQSEQLKFLSYKEAIGYTTPDPPKVEPLMETQVVWVDTHGSTITSSATKSSASNDENRPLIPQPLKQTISTRSDEANMRNRDSVKAPKHKPFKDSSKRQSRSSTPHSHSVATSVLGESESMPMPPLPRQRDTSSDEVTTDGESLSSDSDADWRAGNGKAPGSKLANEGAQVKVVDVPRRQLRGTAAQPAPFTCLAPLGWA